MKPSLVSHQKQVASTPHESVRVARRFLDRHYNTPITIQQLSREAALSPYHFIRVFQRVYKVTPHQYLVQQRISKAKELLRTTDISITDICFSIGFESLGSFSALFRKVAGISPSAYRLNAQSPVKPAYIPLCVCMLHEIDDQEDH